MKKGECMIDIAIEVVFLGAMALFWYMAKNSTLRVFRILFVLGGFLFLYAAFTTAATFTTAYTVPASPADPSYNQANIASLTNVMYTFANVSVIFAVFYLMIELAIY